MAIQVNINKPNPRGPGFLAFPSAYCVIEGVEYSKSTSTAIAHLVVYDKKEGVQIDYLQFNFQPSVTDGSRDFVTQAYSHIMSRPEFSEAVMC